MITYIHTPPAPPVAKPLSNYPLAPGQTYHDPETRGVLLLIITQTLGGLGVVNILHPSPVIALPYAFQANYLPCDPTLTIRT